MKKFSWLSITCAILLAACSPLGFESSENDFNLDGTVDSYTVTLQDGTMMDVCGLSSWTLWAGQSINAGTLAVSNDETNLYVTYSATSGNTFGTLHLWVGTDLTLLPAVKNGPNAGTPIPGQFPHAYDTQGGTEYTFTIPLSSITISGGCGTSINIVAHAEMQVTSPDGTTSGETAFGGSTPGAGPRWWFYATYGVKCCVIPPPPAPKEKYGTAFVKGGYVFTTDKKSNPERLPSLSLTKNRWGWAINLTAAGTTTYDIWNGAGLNYTSKGHKVGTATVDFTGTQVTVTMNYFSGYGFEEAHIYADDFKPTTLAPGQYGYTEYYNPVAGSDSYTFAVADTNGDGIWLIVHSVAYGPGMTNPL
jgi:hypothetical protein